MREAEGSSPSSQTNLTPPGVRPYLPATMKREIRLDYGALRNAIRTPQGGLLIPAAVTRIGVLEYTRDDGSKIRELRPPEEVFNPASLATLPHAVVTDLHPPVLVTPDNYQTYSRGHVCEGVEQDGDFVVARLVVQDKALCELIEKGERKDTSSGYEMDIDPTPGVWNGEPYDQVQRNIRYNHVGIGPEGWGRAGTDVGLRLDSATSLVHDLAVHVPTSIAERPRPQENTMRFRLSQLELINKSRVRVDGVEYPIKSQGERQLATMALMNAHSRVRAQRTDGLDAGQLQAALNDALGTIEQLQQMLMAIASAAADAPADPTAAAAAADTNANDAGGQPAAAPAQGAAPAAQPAAAPAKQEPVTDAALDAMVEQRRVLIDNARALAPSVAFDGKSKREVMIAAITARMPDVRFDGQSDDYVSGLFQSLVFSARGDSSLANVREAVLDASSTPRTDGASKREASNKAITDRWKTAPGA